MCWTYEAVRAAADLVDMRDAHGHFSLKSGHLVRWPPHKTLAINELRRAGRPRRYPLKVARWPGSEDSRFVAEGCHDWPPLTQRSATLWAWPSSAASDLRSTAWLKSWHVR